MLTRDDIPVLNDWLEEHFNQFDEIYCLDGSITYKQESKEIISNYKNVLYFHDEEFPDLVKKDHPLRKTMFDKIKETVCDEDTWIVLIHPDEFYEKPLREYIEQAKKININLIKLYNCHNLPHKSELEDWKIRKSYKCFNHFVYPGCKEDRIFKYDKNMNYSDNMHSNLVPLGFRYKSECLGKIFHYKIQTADVNFYSENGITKSSCWAGISSHYPNHHKFRNTEDFFMEIPCGRYSSNKFIHRFN